MRGAAFWKADWFPGLAVSVAVFAIVAGAPGARSGVTGPVGWLASGLVAVYLVAVRPRLSVVVGALATLFLAAALVIAYFALRQPALMVTALSVLAGELLLVGRRLLLRGDHVMPAARTRPAPLPPSPREVTNPPSESLPAQIGRYRIKKRLGRGAMGEVFLGREEGAGTIVAIKTLALTQAFAPDELADVRARFFREAETAGRLRHPDIVAIHDAGEAGDLAYIAMEFLGGTDLRPFTRPDHLLPLPTVARIGVRIADALAYAHSHNVVHRDIKPANVMYDPATDQLRIMDFGVARITDSSRTKTGMVLGTPSYMSPEQLLGKKVDGRTDLYSLGVMLYQLACGQLPFVGQSLGQLMARITNEACPDVRAVNPQVPDAFAGVIERAMRKAVAERFQTGDEMAQALRACFAMAGDPRFDRPAGAGGVR